MPYKDPVVYRTYQKTYRAKYYASHREKELAANAEWRETHPLEELARCHAYRQTHVEERRAADRKRNKDHPEQNRMNQARYKARKQSLPDTWTPDQRIFMLTYWSHACAVCGNQEGFYWTLADDHWIPLVSATCPGTTAENMVPLCHGEAGCNNIKQGRMPDVWLAQQFSKAKATRILRAIAAYFAEVHRRFPITTSAAAD